MYRKWRTSLNVKTKHPVHSTESQAFLQVLLFVLTATILLVSPAIVGCSKARANPPQSEPLPDMSLNDYALGCSTTGCHQQLTQTKWVHAPVATGSCFVCHQSIGASDAHTFEPVATDASDCASCHSFGDSPVSSHEPFTLGTCHDCHDPHGGDKKNFTLVESTQQLCQQCHDEFGHGGIASESNHLPVVKGDCLTCHAAHQSSHEKLLVVSKDTLCLGCHQSLDHANHLGSLASEDQRTNIHDPIINDNCMTCHLPHSSDDAGLLVDDQRSVCLGCHTELAIDLDFAQSVHSPFDDQQACTQCHDPHASDHDGMLAEPSTTLCFTCHDQSIESASGRTIPNMKKLIDESLSVHEPAANGECSSCHDSHFSVEHSLLRENYPDKDYAEFNADNYAMCIRCHDSAMIEEDSPELTGFRNETQNLHFVHTNREKGRACGICHQPHAGSLPMLMREEFPFGPGGWNLPIGYQKTDTGGSCLSACHEPRTYGKSFTP